MDTEKFEVKGEIWAMLLHLGMNMWSDRPAPRLEDCKTKADFDAYYYSTYAERIRFDEGTWRRVTERMAAIGMNMAVLDLGEFMEFPSHPELAVKGSWKPERLREELLRLRGMGIEPVPKLNFSTCHDTWLKEYEKMVSTPEYYRVCADVIRDVAEVFDHPRLFHIGWDEEYPWVMKKYDYVSYRRGELLWHDFNFFVGECERHGARAWSWAGQLRRDTEEYFKRTPKKVLVSSWYYNTDDRLNRYEEWKAQGKGTGALDGYMDIDRNGLEQVLCSSNWTCRQNFGFTVPFARKHLNPKRLKGFMFAPWVATVPCKEKVLMDALDIVDEVKRADAAVQKT